MRHSDNRLKIIALALAFAFILSGCAVSPATISLSKTRSAAASTPKPTISASPTQTASPSQAPTLIPSAAPVSIIDITPEPVYIPSIPTLAPAAPAAPGTLANYGVYTPNDPEYRLSVPNIRQDWEPWRYQNYAFTTRPIEMAGCALTSLTMLMNYYGLNSDPQEMNDWLKNNGGYAGADAIIWSVAVSRVAGLVNLGVIGYPYGADLGYIRSVIDRGFPVLAEVYYKGTSHYVVLTGYNETTFYVNDPWYENPGHTLNSTVYLGSLPVAYDNADNPALTIKSIVLIATTNPIPLRSRVFTVKSAMQFVPGTWLLPIKMPSVEFIAGDPNMYVNGVARLISPNAGITPVMIGGKMMIPLKALTEVMGGTAEFDAMQNKMTVSVQGRFIESWAGIRTAYSNTWFFDYFQAPILVNGEFLVSAEVIAAQLVCGYSWDPTIGKATFHQ